MAYSVTSWFINEATRENPAVVRKFTIAGSDYSNYVVGWPTISSKWDDLQPNNITINLANEEKTFNFFKTAKTNLQSACEIKLGFTHPTSGDETIIMFSGKVSEITFRDAAAQLRLVDKVQLLSDRLIGTSNSTVVFSSSILLPSDIAWTCCTCYGGFSNITSTSNPDIDYQAWRDWAAVFSADNVLMHGAFSGARVTEVIRKISQQTQSAAFMANNKLTFARWTTIASGPLVTLSDDQILSLGVSIKSDTIINKQIVEFAYNVTSKSWAGSVNAANSASVNSFGTRESFLRDESVWFVNSANALNMAQRSLFVNANPYDEVLVSTTLAPLHKTVGDMVAVSDNHLDVGEGWRIMSSQINLDTGNIILNINGSQINTPFLLDFSALDGGDLIL